MSNDYRYPMGWTPRRTTTRRTTARDDEEEEKEGGEEEELLVACLSRGERWASLVWSARRRRIFA